MSRVSALTELDNEEKFLTEDYYRRAGSPGHLTGALPGNNSWNIKPVVVGSSKLSLVRFSNPAFKDSSLVKDLFRKEFYQTAQHANKYGIQGVGESEGQFWVIRSYFQRTLVDLEPNELKNQTFELIKQLIDQVKAWQGDGILHGHLTPSNIAFENNNFFVIDFNFGLLDDFERETFAPEIRGKSFKDVIDLVTKDQKSRAAIDLFGLGLILEKSIGSYLNTEQLNWVKKLQSKNINERPDIVATEKFFSSHFSNKADKSREAFSLQVEPSVEAALEWLKGTTRLGPELVSQIRELIETKKVSPIKAIQSAGVKQFPSIKERSIGDSVNDFGEAKHARVFFFILLFLILSFFAVNYFNNNSIEAADSNFKSDWISNIPSKMQSVAKAAIDASNQIASSVIVEDVLKGSNRPQVNSKLIKLAFNPLWEQQLNFNDRTVALKLGLGSLIGNGKIPEVDYKSAHAAVNMALMAATPLGQLKPEQKRLSLETFIKLPSEYGLAFTGFSALGYKDFSKVELQAYLKMLAGDHSVGTLQAYVASETASEITLKKLAILSISKLISDEVLTEAVNFASAGDQSIDLLFRWFKENETVDWEVIPTKRKILLASGQYEGKLNPEYIFDLFKFPVSSIRVKALDSAKEYFNLNDLPLLEYMSSDNNKFSRTQSSFLLRAFRINEPTFIAKWFSSEPNPELVIDLLIVRSNLSKTDTFGVEAARYLKDRNWTANLTELELLAQNPDSLVRALAYSRLDASTPESKKLIERMIRIEPDERLKKELEFKLQILQ